MKMGSWARGLLAAALLAGLTGLTGCGDFWEAPSSSSTDFTLSNSGNITVSAGSTGSETITVTPENSFTGTVTLSCSVSGPSGATDPLTCSFSSSSVTLSSTSSETATMTATTQSGTTAGAYDITVTGVSSSVAETTTFCVEVGSGTCTSTAATSGDFYILNSNAVTGYTFSSGSLTAISSSVSLSGVIPYSMAISPNGNFLYVGTSNGVYMFPITSGVLGTGVQVNSDLAYSVRVDSTGSWLFDDMQSTGGVAIGAEPISSSSGEATGTELIQTYSVSNAAVQPDRMVISPDNTRIFASLGAGGTIIVPFNANPGTGNSPLPTSAATIGVANAGTALSVAVDPSNRLLYIGETLASPSGTSGGLRVFNYSSLSGSSITQATGSPVASGGLAPNYILPLASGSYVYVANGAGAGTQGNVAEFAITGSSSPYTITAGSTAVAGIQPASMAEDSTGSYVFEVGSTGSPYFDAYTIGSSGALTSQLASTTSATSISIVAAP